ncbi:MAG: 3-phosphoshikimate 1-carboxyvinyltransferase [Oscillospiraceae bacterium]
MDIKLTPTHLSGEIMAIPSKSDAHRSLIAAALSNAQTVINCGLISKDIEATVNCLNAMGADIKCVNEKLIVKPIDKNHLPNNIELYPLESGSTFRFLLTICAALGIDASFHLEGRLSSRPIIPLRRQLEENGIDFSQPWENPVKISGKLKSGEFVLKGDVSSQFVTGLLFALPLLEGDSTIRLIPPVMSKPYINMTIDTLSKFNIKIKENENEYFIKGNQEYITPSELDIDGDWSNAAFFLAAGAFSDGITVKGLNLNSLQGDKEILDLLSSMGAKIEKSENSITVRKGELKGINIDAGDIPDIIPIISVVASAANGAMTTVTNAERLRLKECDRLSAMCECLNNIGAVVAEMDDGLVIWSEKKLRGGNVFSFNDHRIVMSMAIASTFCENEITIRNAEAIEKSYPLFFEDFKKLGGKADVINDIGQEH